MGDRSSFEDNEEFDTFTVRIHQPLQYDLTPSLLRRLVSQGAFHGIEDGREDEYGPIFIKDFELLSGDSDDDEQPAIQEIEENQADLSPVAAFRTSAGGVSNALSPWST